VQPEIIRVEPISTHLARSRTPPSVVVRHGVTAYVSARFLNSGEAVASPIERQTELVRDQLKLYTETAAGSSLANVLKWNVYCTSVKQVRESQLNLSPVRW
jgi:2-iminobutanoate/2-iminopropanoate deaminase